jgi:hypothetical protein
LKNQKIIKSQSFLTVLFASLLVFNKLERAAAAVGRNSVCELRYHGPRVGPEGCNLIEKMVSVTTVIDMADLVCENGVCCHIFLDWEG